MSRHYVFVVRYIWQLITVKQLDLYGLESELKMSLSETRVLLLTLSFLFATREGSSQVIPSNAVAVVGGETSFKCSSDSALDWILSRDGTSKNEVAITTNCTVDPGLRNKYKTEQQMGPDFTCNLFVFNVTMEQAGIYGCTDSNVTNYALLTVIDPFPEIVIDPSTNVVVKGQDITITCSLNYNGSVAPAPTMRPNFYWTDFNGRNVSNLYDSTTENATVSHLTITADQQDVMPHTCHVYLNLASSTGSGSFADNIPIVNNSAKSLRLRVLSPSTSTAQAIAATIELSTTPTTTRISLLTRATTTTDKTRTTKTTTPSQPIPTSASTAKSTTSTSQGTTLRPCGTTAEPLSVNGSAIAIGILFIISFAANIVLAVLVVWLWKLRARKKNVEHKMTNLDDIQPTYESLQHPDAATIHPDIYDKLQEPVVFNPKRDIPKAIASKNASDADEVHYINVE